MVSFPIYSADSHIIEPPDLWTERIDSEFRDRAPQVVHLDDTDLWVLDGEIRMAVVGIQNQAGLRFESPELISKSGRYAEIPELTPDRYIQDLDRDGVQGAVLYSSNAHQAYRTAEQGLLSALARAYNNWIIEFCRTYPVQLKAIAMLNVDDPLEALQEMERTAKLGASGFMIPILPQPGCRYDQPQYQVLWSAAEEIGLPLSWHIGSNRAVFGREPVIDLLKHTTKDIHFQTAITTLILSGVFACYPKLQVVAVEFGTSWVLQLAESMDQAYKRYWNRAAFQFPDGELPSDYLRRNIYMTFQEDIPGIKFRHLIGVDNMMWGNDYPHAESTFPHSQEFLAEHFQGVPETEAAKIAGGNAQKLYKFPR
jgi:predicted TIM-barrel fold metal-dependent hydrolase